MIHTVVFLSSISSSQLFFTPCTILCIALPAIPISQIVHILKKDSKYRHLLWLCLLVPYVPLITNLRTAQLAATDARLTYANYTDHPIEHRFSTGALQFQSLMKRQSKTYDTAVEEYKRRYKTNPAPGFHAWYNYTVLQESPIIDDFDTMYSSIIPLWRLSGRGINDMIDAAYEEPGSELWLCEFKSSSGRTSCRHATKSFDRNIGFLMNRLLAGLKGAIPDVRFLVNHLDEPRVLNPSLSQRTWTGPIDHTQLSHHDIWDTLTSTCKQPSNHQFTPNDTEDASDLPFITSHTVSLDLCAHPEYRSMHGLFQSPTSFRLFSNAVPIHSTGAPSTMGDILFPSPAYIEDEFQYDSAKDIAWAEKTNELYWRGSTTGAFAEDDTWPSFHRQRFVALAQGLEQKNHIYLRKRDRVISFVKSSFLDKRLFNVAFTRIFQCERAPCRAQRMYFTTKPWADSHAALSSRLAFDLDGNGISGRYYQLLASRSAPLKQTLLREWHDDRLVPWVHYIPVSMGMEELPELVAYLTQSEEGQERAREVAEQGRKWFAEAMKEVDMGIYVYRLMLELARLQDPKREAMVEDEKEVM